MQFGIANITVLQFLFLRRGKIQKFVTARTVSVSGADSAQICLGLRLLFAQINRVLGTFLSLPAVAFRHPYFSCPGESSTTYADVNFKCAVVGVAVFILFFLS